MNDTAQQVARKSAIRACRADYILKAAQPAILAACVAAAGFDQHKKLGY